MAAIQGWEPRRLTPEELGTPDYGKALRSGFETFSKGAEAIAKPKMLAESFLAQKLANKINDAKAQYAMQSEAANLENTQAGTGLVRENTLKQRMLNEYLPQREQAEIGEIGARGEYYKSGGGRGSTGSKDYQQYEYGVQEDNPHLTPDQVREATNVIASGGNQLSDGTILNAPSIKTKTALDRAIRATTTAAQLNNSLDAHQADAEIDVLEDYANKGLHKYGTTYLDMSPKQIMDSFSNDPNAQKDLGKLIASQALQFEVAQQRIKLARGQPGVTSTNELIDLSKQVIKTKFPKLTAEAREEASRYMNEALKEGLKARDRLGIGAGSTYKYNAQANSQQPRYQEKLGGAKGEEVAMYKNGVLHFIPIADQEEARSLGYTYE